jgi:hypothetical protein
VSDPGNAIKLGKPERLGEDSYEIARLWVTHNGPSTVYINAHTLRDPALFGMLLADTAHHGARAYAAMYGIAEEEALAKIWQGLDSERGGSSGELETIESTEGQD